MSAINDILADPEKKNVALAVTAVLVVGIIALMIPKKAKVEEAPAPPAKKTKSRSMPVQERAAPVPVPAPSAEENAAAAAAKAAKNKKKKMKKKAKAATTEPATAPTKKPPTTPPKKAAPVVTDDESDDEEEDMRAEAARLLGMQASQQSKKILAAATTTKKKKKSKKKEDAAAAATPAAGAASTEEWTSVSKQDANGKDDASDTAAPSALEPRTVTIPIGSNNPSIFIGKGGQTIQKLEADSGARFDISRETGTIKITGLEGEVNLAVQDVRAIIEAEEERKRNTVTEVQNYGSEGVKAVIGRGGGTIQAIQGATGAKIDANVEQGTVTLTGARDAVEEARTLCHNAVHGEAQDEIELGSRNAVNVVFGKGFVRIREIQDATECKLDIQRGSTKLKLSGSQEAVASARKTVEELLELNRGIEMMIDGTRVGAVYGKSGATLRSIQDKTGAFIEVDRNGDTATCSIMGPPEVVERAKTLVQKAVDGEVELKPGEILEAIDLGIATPAVIGKGGSRVAELEKAHGVKVNVDSTTSTCKIMGPTKNVAAAKEAIEAIAKPLLDAQAAMKEADLAVDAGDSAWAGGALDPDAEGW